MIEIYTKEDYAKAYTEVLEILKCMSSESVKKIPKEKIEMYEHLKDKSYNYKYNEEMEFDNQNVSHLAQIIIANLYVEYLADEEEKQIIKEYDKKELEELEEEKKETYNINNLFNNKKTVIDNINNEEKQSLEPYKKYNIFKKIIEKIRTIFK